ncbi:hypothetical protein I4200191B4_15780 [Pseudoflavonifractor gallinarum]
MIAKLVIFLWAYYSDEKEPTQGWHEETDNYMVAFIGTAYYQQAGQVWPHLLFFAVRGDRKNACWGASPNPAIKLSREVYSVIES